MKINEIKDKTLDNLLYYAAQEASKELVDEMPAPESVEFSYEHERKMKKLFKNSKKISTKSYLKRASAIVAVFIIISGISIASVQAWRIRFLNFIMHITESNTELRYKENDTESSSYSADDVNLEYVPNGFKLSESRNSSGKIYLRFENKNLTFSLYIRQLDSTLNVDTENADAKVIKLNGKDAFITEKGDIIAIIWNSETKSFALSGNLSEEEIIKIAENIKN